MPLTCTTGARRCLAVLLGTGIVSRAPDVLGAELSNARLELVRSANAGECKDEPHFAEALRARMTAGQNAALELLSLQVAIDREDQAYVATIRVAGRKQGVRTLRADGPSCEPLHDALMVALLLLLDEDPTKPPAPAQPPAPTPAPSPSPSLPPSPAPPSESPSASSPIPPIWLSAGAALTSGMPHRLSLAVSGEAAMRIQRFDVGVGGFWAPERTMSVDLQNADHIGSIKVRMAGARARGCYAFAQVEPVLRVSGCAQAVLSALTGEGQGAATGATGGNAQTLVWFLAGAGPDVHIALTERIALGISGSVFLATTRPSFYFTAVNGAPLSATKYDADSVTAWGGVDFRVRIW